MRACSCKGNNKQAAGEDRVGLFDSPKKAHQYPEALKCVVVYSNVFI